jgi:hypothetical protein
MVSQCPDCVELWQILTDCAGGRVPTFTIILCCQLDNTSGWPPLVHKNPSSFFAVEKACGVKAYVLIVSRLCRLLADFAGGEDPSIPMST